VVGQVLQLRKMGLGLLAACAILAVGASASQAEKVEWGKCVATAGGKYTDPGCTEKAEHKRGVYLGGYEWEAREGRVHLEPMHLVGDVKFETAAGARIECSVLGSESDFTGHGPDKAETPFWEFLECESEGQPCSSNNSLETGEINDKFAFREEGEPTPGWNGKLGFISGKGSKTPVVGVMYQVRNHERAFEPVACEGPIGTVWIGGSRKGGDSFISTIGPVNETTRNFTQTYSESAPGVQSPASFEGKKPVHLEAFLGGHWEPVAMTAEFHYELEPEEEWEIKATR
jgi:hypothetical protein